MSPFTALFRARGLRGRKTPALVGGDVAPSTGPASPSS
jgi:hypothetical protein